jgi:hypothetical protein
VLCTSGLLVRDDNDEVVCGACGARLEVLPLPTETRVRHVGEALESAEGTLEPAAVERALVRLRERKIAQSEVFAEPLASARFRRATIAVGILASGLGAVVVATGAGRIGVVLLLGGLFLVLGAVGMRSGMGWSMLESQQRQREREAQRMQQSLTREIARRERWLAEVAVTRSGAEL